MPKTLPLSSRHRRSRQRNLRSLLSIEHDHVSTTRIVSDDNITNSCDENDSNDNDVTTKCPINPKQCLTPCFDSFSSFDNTQYDNANVSKVSLSDDISFAATFITPSSSEDGYTTPKSRFVRHPLPSVSLADLTDDSSCVMKTKDTLSLSSALEKQCSGRPRSCSIESQFGHGQQDVNCSTPWGQFVEMQIPEDDEVSYFATSPSEVRSPVYTPGSLDSKVQKQSFGSWYGKSNKTHDPYPRDSRSMTNANYRRRSSSSSHATKRIPLTFSTRFRQTQTNTQLNESLQDFILMSPDVEDATFHLGSLSF